MMCYKHGFDAFCKKKLTLNASKKKKRPCTIFPHFFLGFPHIFGINPFFLGFPHIFGINPFFFVFQPLFYFVFFFGESPIFIFIVQLLDKNLVNSKMKLSMSLKELSNLKITHCQSPL